MSSPKERLEKSNNNGYYSIREITLAYESLLKTQYELTHKNLNNAEKLILAQSHDRDLERIKRLKNKPYKRPETRQEAREKGFEDPFYWYFLELTYYLEERAELNKMWDVWLATSKKWIKKMLLKDEKKMDAKPKMFYHTAAMYANKIQPLQKLQFTNEEDNKYNHTRIGMLLFSYIHTREYINLRLDAIPEGIETVEEELKRLEKKVENYQKAIFLLDKLLDYSQSLAEDNLDENTKALVIRERNKLRLAFGVLLYKEFKDTFEEDQAKKQEFGIILEKEMKELEKMRRSGRKF